MCFKSTTKEFKYDGNTLPLERNNPSYTNLNAGYIDVSDYTPLAGEITNIKNASGLWRD